MTVSLTNDSLQVRFPKLYEKPIPKEKSITEIVLEIFFGIATLPFRLFQIIEIGFFISKSIFVDVIPFCIQLICNIK